MNKRRYTNMLALLPVIEQMLESGMRHREIEDELGLEGDRPVHNLLKRQRRNVARNPKTVLRVMKKYGLLSEIRRRRKWVTDISYIQTREGVLYLSMIRDLYDNSIVAYRTATQQTVNLVLVTIRLAMKKEKKKIAAELQLHSDQGFQYTSQAYFKLTQSYGITPSMSSKGNPYDNAMAEISSLF